MFNKAHKKTTTKGHNYQNEGSVIGEVTHYLRKSEKSPWKRYQLKWVLKVEWDLTGIDRVWNNIELDIDWRMNTTPNLGLKQEYLLSS